MKTYKSKNRGQKMNLISLHNFNFLSSIFRFVLYNVIIFNFKMFYENLACATLTPYWKYFPQYLLSREDKITP